MIKTLGKCFISIIMIFALVSLSLITIFAAGGKLTVEEDTTPSGQAKNAEELVSAILGQGITFSNITYTGHNSASGIFTEGKDTIGLESGIVLSTGIAKKVEGPNEFKNCSQNLTCPGDSDLEALLGNNAVTNDATVLEFDFIPDTSYLTFFYVFGSEEYNEYVGTQFNDVFGFFVNGVNYALVPGSNDIVSVNSINKSKNPSYFRDNDPRDSTVATEDLLDTELDGLTTVLKIEAYVKPGETNHIKLAIADTGDHNYDSAVFITGFSSQLPQVSLENPTELTVEETVGEVQFTVVRDISLGVSQVDIQLVDGTATAPSDYTNVSTTITFEDGETSKTISIPIIDNDSYQGERSFNVQLQNPSNAVIVDPSKGSVTITDDESKPTSSESSESEPSSTPSESESSNTPSESEPSNTPEENTDTSFASEGTSSTDVIDNPATGEYFPTIGVIFILAASFCIIMGSRIVQVHKR